MKSTALPRWMYSDPAKIADGLIDRTRAQKLADERHAELYRLTKSRRIKRLTRLAKLGKSIG